MSTEQIVGFVLFAVVAAITPGPSNIILASAGANGGVGRGLPCLFGVVLGMGCMLFLVALGLGRLVLGHPSVLIALKWGGTGLLLWLAWQIATAGHGATVAPREVIGFWQAAALQWVNPKSWLVSASAVGTYVNASTGDQFGQSVMFGGLFMVAALPSCFVWLAFGATVQRLLQTERALRRFNVGMAVLLAGSIAFFIW